MHISSQRFPYGNLPSYQQEATEIDSCILAPDASSRTEYEYSGHELTMPVLAQNENHAAGYALAAVLLWSTVATAFKLGLEQLSVLQLLWLGTAVSWLVFLFNAGLRGQLAVNFTTLRRSLVLGIINPVAYYLILFQAYQLLPAHIAQPLNYTWAITLALLAIPILKQRLQLKSLVAILVSYLGVVILLYGAGIDRLQPINALGVALALSSTVLWALYWLLNTRWPEASANMMFWSFTWALMVLTCCVAWLDVWPEINSHSLIFGTWVGLIEMGLTYLLWQRALTLTRQAARIGQLIFLSPFLSLLIIHQVLGEQIHGLAVVGLVIIVVGIGFSQANQANHAQP